MTQLSYSENIKLHAPLADGSPSSHQAQAVFNWIGDEWLYKRPNEGSLYGKRSKVCPAG